MTKRITAKIPRCKKTIAALEKKERKLSESILSLISEGKYKPIKSVNYNMALNVIKNGLTNKQELYDELRDGGMFQPATIVHKLINDGKVIREDETLSINYDLLKLKDGFWYVTKVLN